MTVPSEEQSLAILREADAAIVAGVDRELTDWACRSVARILDAWDRLPADARAQADRDARRAGDAARERVVGELRVLFATDPASRTTSPQRRRQI